MMCAIMKTFLKLFEQYIQEILIFFWIILCLDVNYNKGIENGNWLIYTYNLLYCSFILQSAALEIMTIMTYSIKFLFERNTSSYVIIELLVPDKFSIRGNIKNRFCEEKCGMDFACKAVEASEKWKLISRISRAR